MVFFRKERNSARETEKETEISGEHDNISENLRVFYLFLWNSWTSYAPTNRQYLNHMFTSVNPNINALYESAGRVWNYSEERQVLMNYELVELSTGLIFIKISTSNLNVLHALKYYFFSSQSWWVQ